jgi:hypothetical protein
MKKLTVYRASGLPVNAENVELFTAAHRAFYDKVVGKYMPNQNKIPDQLVAERVEKILKRYEARLFRKYPSTEQWPLLKSNLAWKRKIKELGFPIGVAQNADNGELVYVILDTEF